MKYIFLLLPLFFFACANEKEKEMPIDNTEQHRPNYHFTPPQKWMNDPNGMVFFEEEYHLFYQYYPDSTVWGPMHWGHAVSKDLVSWEHLPIALYPDSLGYIFSGSAVVDWKNSSGFGVDGKPPLVAIFTYHDPVGEKAGRDDFQYQGIAYSNDHGRTWTKYEGNPVIPNPGIRDFRDPKVIWDEDSGQWVMVFAAWDQVKLYGSPDLKTWEHLSDWGKEWGTHAGVWECPDLFPMTVEGTDKKKWVLLQSLNPGSSNGGSGTQYFVGDFDGKNFILDEEMKAAVKDSNAVWLDWGRDNYAGVTFSDVPNERRIFMGWMSNWDYAQIVPTVAWRSAMTIPRELTLVENSEGLRLVQKPVKEMNKLRKKLALEIPPSDLSKKIDVSSKLSSTTALEIILTGENLKSKPFGVELSNSKGERYSVGYDPVSNEFFSDRTHSGKVDFSEKFAAKVHTAPRISDDSKVQMHLFIDVASCELFAEGGQTVMTDIFFPNEDFTKVKYFGEGRLSGQFWELE